MKYSIEELCKFLSISNMKLKRIKRSIKNVRIERNIYKSKLQEIEDFLNNNICSFDKYDCPSDRDIYISMGQRDLKREIMKIIDK